MKTPRNCSGALIGISVQLFALFARKELGQIVFAVLLGDEEQPGVVIEFLGAGEAVDRCVAVGHVQAGGFIVFFRCRRSHAVCAQRDESDRSAGFHIVRPDRVGTRSHSPSSHS